jgi:hypothetical protein
MIDEFGRSPNAVKIKNHNLGRLGVTALGKQVQIYASGERVRIVKVYTYIHTGVAGRPNYVYADVVPVSGS